jgi:hypothetical protein
LGFFHRNSNVILLLKSSCICKSCYEKAVPNGYLIHGEPFEPSVFENADSVQWWQFRPVGFESYGLTGAIRLPLQTSSEEHGMLLQFLNHASPFYMPLFHTMGRVVPKALLDLDNAITTTHGLPLVSTYRDRKAARRSDSQRMTKPIIYNREADDGEPQRDRNRSSKTVDVVLIQGAKIKRVMYILGANLH